MRLFPDDQRLGLGSAPLGNLFGEVSEADAVRTVDAAWEEGWRYFDTAPHYGLGLAEERLGAGLRSRPRDEYVLSSKVGRVIYEADTPAPGATFNYAPADAALVAKANKLADVCESHGVTLPTVALAFPFFHPAVAGVAVGCRTADEVHTNAARSRTVVPTALWSDLKSTGLLRDDAPTPG
jgi:aryl-alcohol dehydrogenase-like predicted oxidoreductase